MTALDLNRPPLLDPRPPIICVDSRAVTAAEVQLGLRYSMAQAQLAWVGFRHSAILEPILDTGNEVRAREAGWLGFAETLFPRSRRLTTAEAQELDAVVLKGATPLGRKRRY